MELFHQLHPEETSVPSYHAPDQPAVLAAIDIAKSFHEVIIEPPSGRRERLRIANTMADFKVLVRKLRRYQVPCHVAFEATGDYHRPLASFLGRNGCQLHLVASLATNRTREARYNSWDKNDSKDAQVILHLLKTGGTQIYHDPLADGYHDLRELAKAYQQVSLRRVRLYHTIMTHYLPLYFPEAERFANSSRTEWYTQLLLLTPCPSAVLAYSKADFVAAASRVSGRKCDKVRLLGEFYETAKNSIGLPVSENCDAISMFRLTLREFAALCGVRRQLELETTAKLDTHPDFQRLRTIPGIGPVLGLLILAEAGNLRRFSHHRKFLKYCGLDLCTEQSGKFRGVTRLSKRGNATLRYAFWLAATIAIRMGDNTFSAKFQSYVRSDPKNADLRRKAYTAVAAKVARVTYSIVKAGTDYRRFLEATVPSGRIPTSKRIGRLSTT